MEKIRFRAVVVTVVSFCVVLAVLYLSKAKMVTKTDQNGETQFMWNSAIMLSIITGVFIGICFLLTTDKKKLMKKAENKKCSLCY